MASWHEVARIHTGFVISAPDGRADQVVQRSEQDADLFEVYFRRKETEGRIEYPDGWIQLWPIKPLLASTSQDARAKAGTLLEVVANREHDELFEKRPLPAPLSSKRVNEVKHPTYAIEAVIFRYNDTRFEIRYFGDLEGCDWESGWRLMVPNSDGMVVPEGFELLSLADCLEDAKQVAIREMQHILSEGTPIRLRQE